MKGMERKNLCILPSCIVYFFILQFMSDSLTAMFKIHTFNTEEAPPFWKKNQKIL